MIFSINHNINFSTMPLPHSINEDIHTVSEFHRMAMLLWS